MNTFVYHGPLAPDSPLFCGRDVELAQLKRLCQGEVRAYAIVYGGRQTGKTSLLLRLATTLPESVRTCRVDFQGLPDAKTPQVYSYLAQRVTQCLSANPHIDQPTLQDHLDDLDLPALRNLIDQHFNEEDLRDLCFDLGVEYHSLAAEGKRGKARELIDHCKRHKRLAELVGHCYQLHPNVAWPNMLARPAVTDKIDDAPHLVEFLCQAVSRLGAGRLVLLLEELGALPQESRNDLANVLRYIFSNRTDLSCRPLSQLMVVLAGSVELYELAATQVSTLHNICEAIYLPDLSREQAVKLITVGLAAMGVSNTNAEALGQAIYTCVGGHPYLTQRLGASLEDYMAAGESLEPALVDRAVEQLTRGDVLLRHLHQALDEQHLLRAAKLLLDERIRFSRVDEEMSRLELMGLACESAGYWKVRNRLLERVLREWTAV